jgi:hypothetical protein
MSTFTDLFDRLPEALKKAESRFGSNSAWLQIERM